MIVLQLFTLFLFNFLYVLTSDPADFKCTEDFCLGYIDETKCPPPDVNCYNESLAIILPSATECNCCETCIMYQKKGEACMEGSPGSPIPPLMCGPSLKCVNKICTDLDGLDPLRTDQDYVCTNGNCSCVWPLDSSTSITLYGTFLEKDMDKSKLQCQCSQSAYKAEQMSLRAFPFIGYQYSARCLPNGQFDPLQCVEGACFCVDQFTGAFDDSVLRIPVELLGPNNPLCFDSIGLGHTRAYYRECEKALTEIQEARDTAEAEGFHFLFPHHVKCLPNGNFAEPPQPDFKKALDELRRSKNGRGNKILKIKA